MSANGIARWNGSAWSALGSGLSGGGDQADALLCDNTGNLYVGGGFTSVSGVSANGIAKWNGSSWSALGTGVAGGLDLVDALALGPWNTLYAGGSFTSAGGNAAYNVAVWNGSSWSALGSGLGLQVNTFAFDPAGGLYAGGQITNLSGIFAVGLAQWNGSTWSALGSGLGPAVLVASLVSDGMGRLYACGAFTVAGTNVSAYVVQANVLTMISKPRLKANGNFAFNLVTTPYTTNRILAAANPAALVWQPVYTNVAPANGEIQFTDSTAFQYPERVYRSSTP